jgi:hypothetical protein
MKLFKNRWLCLFLLLTFTWQFVILASYTPPTLKQMVKSPFAFFVSVLFPSEAFAQSPPDPNDYVINRIPGNFVDISTTGTEISPALSDEGRAFGIPIGFSFEFFGTIFNEVTITSNGYITFGASLSSQNAPIPTTDIPNSFIAPFWDDLNPELNPNSAIYYTTLGATPNRQFAVEWKDVPLEWDPDSRLTFEVILFEESNEIQFHYYYMIDGSGGIGSGLVSGRSATIGIENSAGNAGSEVAFNEEDVVTPGSAFSFTLGGNAFQTGRLLGDLDEDNDITILDQSVMTDIIIDEGEPPSSQELLVSDVAPSAGIEDLAFGDGIIDDQDHALLFEVVMGRASLNPALSSLSSNTATIGDSLTLYGSGFDPVASNNTVIFVDVNGTPMARSSVLTSLPGSSLLLK